MHCYFSPSNVACLALLLAALSSGCGGQDEPSDSEAAPPAPSGPAVVLEGGRLFLDGKPMALPGRIADWEGAIGKASRRESFRSEGEPSITLHIWDSLGILGYEHAGRGTIAKLALVFDPNRATSGEVKLAPRSPFAGTLSLEKVPIVAASAPREVNQRLEVGPFRQLPKFPFSWNLGYGPWTITAITTSDGEGLVEVLIGE